MHRTFGFLAALGLLAAGLATLVSSPAQAVRAADPPATTGEAAPVESDMHEFMEYVFEPTYLRLKPKLAAETADNAAFKAIKSDSLILAEAGNLLLIRQPDEDQADWAKHSIGVRDAGGELYRAAKAKNFPASKQHFAAMIQHCNACHDQFAGGEHQLNP
ncbi:MAG: cytochrome c [Planctomyces sp.]|nr:cytochrome c [Planctomyces sp.]